MHKGVIYSAILHLSVFVAIIFGLPEISSRKIINDNTIIVEILPIAEFTNVRPVKITPQAKPIKKKEVTAAVQPKQSLQDPTLNLKPDITPEIMPQPKAKQKDKIIEKVIEPLPQIKLEKKPEKPQPKKKTTQEEKPEDAFAAVLKSVEEMYVEEEAVVEEEDNQDFGEVADLLSKMDVELQYKPGRPMTMSEKDAIRLQIMSNWTVLSGAKGANRGVVTLVIRLGRDGAVQKITINNKFKYNSDSFYRAMADSAMRAVHKSSPLKTPPLEKYDVKDGWREIEINFDPSEMMY